MRVALFALALSLAATVASADIPAGTPLGEPLRLAAEKFGLSPADVARVKAAGGEFTCPGEGRSGSRLNGWLISDHEILTNAHAIIEGEEDPGHPYLRQPLRECAFESFRQLGAPYPTPYVVNFNGVGAMFRQGARAPLDPTRSVGSDVVRLRLQKRVDGAVPLAFDFSPVAKGDPLLLISRVPTAYRNDTLPGDDLLIEKCKVTEVDRMSDRYASSAMTDCNGAEGMSAGIAFALVDGKLVAKGFLVAIEFVRDKQTQKERVLGSHLLMFDTRFNTWLKNGDCPFWPTALQLAYCGMRP